MYFAAFMEVSHQQHKDSPSTTVCKEPILLILKSSLQMKTNHGFHIKSVQAVWKLWDHGLMKKIRTFLLAFQQAGGNKQTMLQIITSAWKLLKASIRKINILLQYPNFNSALRPVPHVVDAPKPVFNYLSHLEDDTFRYSSISTDDDMSINSFSKSCWLLPDASLFIWPGWNKWHNSWFESTQTVIWDDGIKIQNLSTKVRDHEDLFFVRPPKKGLHVFFWKCWVPFF